MVSIFLRSLVFNILFYLVFLFWVVIALPTFVLPRAAMLAVANWWAQSNILLMRAICNIKVEFRGVEKIPKGPLIVASKHQSMWETISMLRFFEAPFFALKRELMFIPIFGLFLLKTSMIAIDRSAGGPACQSRSIPGCSGRGGPSCAIPARWWSSFSIRCRPGCRAMNFSCACAPRSKRRPTASSRQRRPSRRNYSAACQLRRGNSAYSFGGRGGWASCSIDASRCN